MEEKELLEIIEKLRTLGQEWKTVDAKRELVLREIGDKAEFVKDVVAMANNGEPSYLVIGLEDATFVDVGRLSYHFSKNDLNQILADKIDPPVVIDYNEFAIAGNEYAVVEINGQNLPYIVARDLVHNRTDRKRVRIYKGTIYVRHADRTEGIGRTELEEILKRRGLRKEFENEAEYAQKLALECPDYWEYLLTAELLRSRVEQVRRGVADLERGLIYRETTRMNGSEFMEWASSRCEDLASLVNMLNTLATEEIPASWGKPGEAGDPLEIKRAVDRVLSACNELLEWEANLRSVAPPTSFLPLKETMAGWTSQAFGEIESLPDKLMEPFEQPVPEGVYTIQLVFEEPPGIAEFRAELERLRNHPEKWRDDY